MSGMLQPEVLVLGATGSVGSGVVAALLEAGSPVLAAGQDGPRLQALARGFADEPGLAVLEAGHIGGDMAAAALVERLRQRPRPLRAVFASIGSPPQAGCLLGRPAEAMRQRLEHDLMPHLAAARHLIPRLAEYDGTAHYILIGGPHAERGWAGYGHASVSAAALRMLTQVLHEEAHALGVRVQMLAVAQPLCTPANRHQACAEWPSALAVGRHAVSLLSGNQTAGAVVTFNVGRSLLPPQPLFAQPVLLPPHHETQP